MAVQSLDHPRVSSSCRRGRRRGLAPVEFVLWLPILLFVAALMVNYGTAVAWRIRGELVSRDAAWRVRWPRTGGTEAPPRRGFTPGPMRVWPADARMEVQSDDPITRLDDPRLQHPVVRGPLPNGFVVHPLLDPDRTGAYRGVAEVNRNYPLLPRLGGYESGDIRNPMLRQNWQYSTMGIPRNTYRRTKVLYTLPKTDPQYPRAFVRAVQSVRQIPHFAALAVLDRDEDLRKYRGGYIDFHPMVAPTLCELNPEVVYQQRVRPIVDSRDARGRIRLGAISQLPRQMTNVFLSTYQAAERRLQGELNAIPPPSPSRRAEIQRELAELAVKIGQLEAYRDRLPSLENDMRARAAAVIP